MLVKITPNLFRRRYYDLRFSWGLVGPLLGIGNFALIAYNFTSLKEIPFEVFAIIFATIMVCTMSFVGLFLRRYQMPTDFKLQYERNVEQVRTDLAQLEAMNGIFTHLGHHFDENYKPMIKKTQERINYLKNVLNDQRYDFIKT